MAYSTSSNGSAFKQRSNSAQAPISNIAAFQDRHPHLHRGATPDSDAVASSDDDHDSNSRLSQSAQLVKQQTTARTGTRRGSWLSEVSNSEAQRKKSLSALSGTGPFSGMSQPSTPLTEANASAAPTYFSNTNPFSSSARTLNKPSALSSSTMVAPSPTTANFDDLRSPMSQGYVGYAGVGVPIPNEPLRKTVRSQSYSAAHLEESDPRTLTRVRTGPTHRGSRPSLRENTLHSLQEHDDDGEGDDEFDGSNALSLFGSNYSLKNSSSTFGLPARRGTMPARMINMAADYDEEEDETTPRNASLSNGSGFASFGRASTFSVGAFGSSEDPSQSRRHSLATLPRPRNGSMVQTSDNLLSGIQDRFAATTLNDSFPISASTMAPQTATAGSAIVNGQYRDHSPLSYAPGNTNFNPIARLPEQARMEANSGDRSFAASYFSGAANHNRQIHEPQDQVDNFGVPQNFARPGRVLYIVSFKCARAEIYYVADNMGLELKTGDMVVCEGDRGTDLGTIENVNVTMEEAKHLKQDFNKQHFKNLMMFSRLFPHMAALANNDELLNQTFGQTSSPSSVAGLTGPLEQEPRPKAIKRIANPDEIHLLREKEGQEAKAKRMCQNKTYEHGLRMEILDAEFQHDFKKLTFFYYAEEYINFNELVTDLFKIYKTRIWMSAINAASHSLMNPNHALRPPPQPRPSPYQPQQMPQHLQQHLQQQVAQQMPYRPQNSPYQQQHQYNRPWGPPGPYNQPIPYANY